jgi:hypothetical protein
MSDLAGAFYGDYGMAEANARRRRGVQSIANTQAATLGQFRGNRNIADLSQQYVKGFEPQMAAYGKRGLAGPNVSSGIQRSGLEQYAAKMQKDIGGATETLQDEINRIANTEATQAGDLEEYLNNLKIAKNQNIFNAAVALKEYGA